MSEIPEFPDRAPWAERRRQRIIAEARAHAAMDVTDGVAAIRWMSDARAHIERLADELEGTGE